MQYKISVIIPCYNVSSSIANAILSVQKQTYNIFEIICIDDMSTDNTVEIIETKFPQITLLRNHSNLGAAASRNKGLLHASGDYIAFLDADDIWLPEKTEVQMKFVIEHNLICIGSFFSIANLKDTNINKNKLNLKYLSFYSLCFSNKLITPSVIIKNIGMKFNEGMRYCEDYELWLRLAKCYPRQIGYLNIPLVSLGKKAFGVSGLSSNLHEMHLGEVLALKNNLSSLSIFFKLYLKLKYYRRVLIVFLRNYLK